MRTIIFLIALMLIGTIAYANWGVTKWGGEQYGIGKWGQGSSSGPEEGFLLLETSGDKLLLETGVTDALLLEG